MSKIYKVIVGNCTGWSWNIMIMDKISKYLLFAQINRLNQFLTRTINKNNISVEQMITVLLRVWDNGSYTIFML